MKDSYPSFNKTDSTICKHFSNLKIISHQFLVANNANG